MKSIDIVILFLFVLWAAVTDFTQMTLKDWLSGGILIAYLVYFSIRKGREKAQLDKEKKRTQK